MTTHLTWIADFSLAASIVILAAAVLFHVRRVTKRLAALNLEDIKRRMAGIERSLKDASRELKLIGKEGAETKIRTQALENEMNEIRETSNRYLSIFKTVLYGFDYIVQGCKNALEIQEPEKQPEEKQIVAEEKQPME